MIATTGWETDAATWTDPGLQRFRVYRVSHAQLQFGEIIRLVHPCLIVRAFDQYDAIERASKLECWTIGYGTDRIPGAFLIAISDQREPKLVRQQFGHGLPVNLLRGA